MNTRDRLVILGGVVTSTLLVGALALGSGPAATAAPEVFPHAVGHGPAVSESPNAMPTARRDTPRARPTLPPQAAPNATERVNTPTPEVPPVEMPVETEAETEGETSLAEAMAVPHGHAAGQGVLEVPGDAQIAGVEPGAEANNRADAALAGGVRMKPEQNRRPSKAEEKANPQLGAVGQAGGCTPGYGVGGECLPAAPPGHGGHAGHGAQAWTCADVRVLLPDGIRVISDDRLNLDTNGDGVACGTGD